MPVFFSYFKSFRYASKCNMVLFFFCFFVFVFVFVFVFCFVFFFFKHLRDNFFEGFMQREIKIMGICVSSSCKHLSSVHM